MTGYIDGEQPAGRTGRVRIIELGDDGMEQAEKREYLIKTLLAEQPRYREMDIPKETGEQKRLLITGILKISPCLPQIHIIQ